jgi:hypothetical protein
VRIFRLGETRFLERKLCKELYSAADILFGLYGGEGDFWNTPVREAEIC